MAKRPRSKIPNKLRDANNVFSFQNQQQPDPRLKELEKLKAAQAARPAIPKFESLRDKKTGELLSQYKIKDPGAVRSPWLDQMLEQQGMMQTQALNRGQQLAATQAASAQANLARRGGLSSGAAERLAGAAQEQRTLGAQDIFGQGAQQRLGMQTEDMQQERQFQTGLQESNLQNLLADIAQKRQFDLGKYQEQMKGFAAEKSAQATEKAGGGGTVICTALMDVGLVTPEERKLASNFRSEVTDAEYRAYLLWGTKVANAIRFIPALGYVFRPLVRYWIGDRDLLARAQYGFFKQFNKLFLKAKKQVLQEV